MKTRTHFSTFRAVHRAVVFSFLLGFFPLVPSAFAQKKSLPPSGEVVSGELTDTIVEVVAGDLVITDENGGVSTDTLTLSLVGANVRVHDPNNALTAGAGASQVDLNNVEVPLASVTGNIQVNTLAGHDTLTLSLAGGNFIPAGGVNYAGGDPTIGPGDQLVITGGSQGTVTYNYTSPNDGSIEIGNFGTITYAGLEPITNSGTAADVIFNLPAGPNAATLADDGTGANGMSRLSGATFEDTDFANPTGSVTINRGNAADTLVVNALTDLTASLTIGSAGGGEFSTVTFNGAVTLASGNNLAVFSSSTISLPNTASDLAAAGAGAISMTTARDITLASGASLTAEDGDVTLLANQQVTPTSGNFIGIDVNSGAVQSTGIGAVTLRGKGGDNAAGSQNGVSVRGANGLVKGGSGAGTKTTVEGVGVGSGAGSANVGVFVDISGALISSFGGNVAVTGTGGTGTGGSQIGVRVFNSGAIRATGAGSVTVTGNAGNGGATGAQFGIDVREGGLITSSGGSVVVNGTGGTGGTGSNIGVNLTGNSTTSTITSGANGSVTVTGIGGTGASGNNDGLNFFRRAQITAGGTGVVSVDGTAGNGSGSEGIQLSTDGSAASINSNGGTLAVTGASSTGVALSIGSGCQIQSGSNAAVSLIGDSMAINTSTGVVSAGTGPVTLRQKANGVAINLGSATDATGGPIGLSDGELDRVTAGTLNIGDANSGTITVSAAITHANNLSLLTGAGCSIDQAITMAVNKNLSAVTASTSAGISLTTSSSDLIASGAGTISLTAARNIALVSGASLTTVDGATTLSANQQMTPTTGTFAGISLVGATVHATGLGVVTLNGRGGTVGAGNPGVFMNTSSLVRGGSVPGMTPVLTTDVLGTGGTGGSNPHGVDIENSSSVTSLGGDVRVRGFAGGGTGANNYGVIPISGGNITSGGNGNVVVEGTGGTNAGGGNVGIIVHQGAGLIASGGTGSVTVTGMGGSGQNSHGVQLFRSGRIASGGAGSVVVTGTAGGTFSHGVFLNATDSSNVASIASGSGGITVTGTQTLNGVGINLGPGGLNNSITSTANGPITLISDIMSLDAGNSVVNSGAGLTTIRQKTNGKTINLGGADSTTQLGLGDSELDRVTSGTMQIGDANSGAINVSAAITQAGKITNLFSTGTTVLNVGNLGLAGTVNSTLSVNNGGTLSPGASPGAMSSGTTTFVAGATFAVEFGGTTPGNGATNHDQLNVTGTVALGNANLTLAASGGFVPAGGQSFVILANDDADAISGTFAGLAEGASISNFIGSGLTASLTYVGGDGNDVVINLSTPTVSSSTGNVPADSTMMLIAGTGFSTVPGNNVVAFSNGVTGTVTAATTTQLTVGSLSGLVAGALNASVTVNGVSSGAPVQVATISPVVTMNTANILSNATTLVLDGFGFDSTPINSTVALSSGAADVTSASATSLTLTFTSAPAGGALTAVVTSNGVSSGAPVQVASVTTVSTNADLSDLTLSQGTLTPGFASATLSYTASVPFSATSITATPTAADANAVITVNGNSVASGMPSGSIALAVGSNMINTVVTAQDGTTMKTYTVTVTRAAPPSISIDSVTVSEGDTNAVFTVTQSATSDLTTTFTYSTMNGSAVAPGDYTAATDVAGSIPIGMTTATISIPLTDDVVYENTEAFTVVLGNPMNATIATGSGTSTINDDDPEPAFTIDSVSHNEGNTGQTEYLFTVTKNGASGQSSTVDFMTMDGTATVANNDYDATSGTLNFSSSDTTKTITVQVNGDRAVEPDETFSVVLDNVVNNRGQRVEGALPSGSGTIVNEDNAPVADAVMSNTDENDPITITLSANDADGDALTFSIVSGPSHGSLGAISSPNCSSGSCTATVDYTPTTNYDGPDSFTYKANDGVNDSDTATVSITVNEVIPVVTNTNDSGPGSLRQALLDDESGDVINFNIPPSDPGCSAGVCTISLTSGELVIDQSVTLNGTGADVLIVQRHPSAPDARIFRVVAPGPSAPARVAIVPVGATIQGMTISGGNLAGGTFGGGILNDHATLTVDRCLLSGNSAGGGGAIANQGSNSGSASLTIANSSLSNNVAISAGGGVYHNGSSSGNASLFVSNSTFSGNMSGEGGGAAILSTGFAGNNSVQIGNSTFAGNSSDLSFGGGVIRNDGQGAGIATLEIGNTILKSATSQPNLVNLAGTITSLGYNLSTDTGSGLLNATGDVLNTDPIVGPLKDNGGTTPTHAPLSNSPVIDQGNDIGLTGVDQRGAVRPQTSSNGAITPPSGGDRSDIGAVELPSVLPTGNSASLKTHGLQGEFPIDLAPMGAVTIEPRSGGAMGDFEIAIDFSAGPVTFTSAAITDGVWQHFVHRPDSARRSRSSSPASRTRNASPSPCSMWMMAPAMPPPQTSASASVSSTAM